MAEGFDPDAQLEKTYLAGPTTKKPRRLRLSSLLAVILFVLVGGVGGYFWHQQGWWPAESESESESEALQLRPAERVWCENQLGVVAVSANALGFMSDNFLTTVLPSRDLSNATMLQFFNWDYSLGIANLLTEENTLENVDGFLDVSASFIGQDWIDSKTEGWSNPDVVAACVTAYEAFR